MGEIVLPQGVVQEQALVIAERRADVLPDAAESTRLRSLNEFEERRNTTVDLSAEGASVRPPSIPHNGEILVELI